MPPTGTDASKSGIQVIERASSILRALKTSPSGMSLGQIAKAVELPRSTVQRIVGALQAERILISAADGRGIRLGPELNALAEATRYNIVESCRSLLLELASQTGETADLSVMRNKGMIFLDQVPGIHRLRTISSVGEVFPLTTTANGKACLALLDETVARNLVLEEWERRQIKGNIDSYMKLLKEITQTGLAYDMDEHSTGISAIGFAFKDLVGDLHAISVPVPSTRFSNQRKKIEQALHTTADHLAKTIKQKY